jgi:G:T-mismatch repair DNA endonuclease (very short patch repair protein)
MLIPARKYQLTRDAASAKQAAFVTRDKLHQAALRKLGWRVVVIWECEVEQKLTRERIERLLR